ncbi:hypothetical protein [Sphingobium amiense]|uniref:hypothetical protein n=1 Tax=Sphingobium amiense TaxID=135719 RepID=UPI000F849731|nr:hypothetical protein [Sphingobium amiense]
MVTLIGPNPAWAEARPTLLTVWRVQPPTDSSTTERSVKDGEIVLKQSLLPMSLATLDQSVEISANGLSVEAGSQLVQALTQQGRAYCALDTVSRAKASLFVKPIKGLAICLLDSNEDGRFDSAFGMPGGTGLLMVEGTIPKSALSVDIPYTQRPVEEIKGDFFVALRYEQYFNIYGNRMFFLDYGGRGKTQSLTNFVKFNAKGPFPQSVDVYGARFTILNAEAEGVALRIDQPLLMKTFAVHSYTTTTFIPIRY